MSFVIAAIYKQSDVYIASDSQLTQMSSQIKLHNISKIEFINPSVAIGLSGTYKFCKLVIDVLKMQIARSDKPIIDAIDIEKEIMADIYNAEAMWSQAYPSILVDAILLIAGYNKSTPYISAIAVANHKIDLIHDTAPALQYDFIPAPPKDIDVYDCIDTCTTHLKWDSVQRENPEQTLKSLVKMFADRSQYVDQNAIVQKVPSQD